jgi:hypothetical protein
MISQMRIYIYTKQYCHRKKEKIIRVEIKIILKNNIKRKVIPILIRKIGYDVVLFQNIASIETNSTGSIFTYLINAKYVKIF